MISQKRLKIPDPPAYSALTQNFCFLVVFTQTFVSSISGHPSLLHLHSRHTFDMPHTNLAWNEQARPTLVCRGLCLRSLARRGGQCRVSSGTGTREPGWGYQEQSGTAPAGDGSAWRGTAPVCSAHLAASTKATQKKETRRASWTHRTEYSSSSSQVCPTSAELHLVSLYIHCKPVLSLSPGFDTPGKPTDFHNRSNEQAPRYWHRWF